MRIIDANTGTEVEVGDTFRNALGLVTVLDVDEGLLSARIKLNVLWRRERRVAWSPLTVRYMHPGFMFQKVGFINS